jgi:penicillin amidase
VISDLLDRTGPLLAVAMGNLQPDDTAAAGLLALNQAQTVAQAGAAAPVITAPVQNLLVADRQGIGLFLTGRVPIRRAGDGSRPVLGDGSHDWIGWAAGPDLPHIVAPASGRLVNANEPVVGDAGEDHPFLGRDSFGDWRARRIRTLLRGSDRLTAADFTHFQTDTVSEFARQVLPTLRATPVSEGTAARAQALLKGWDGTMAIDTPQPLIFNAWVAAFYRTILHDAGIRPDQGGPLPEFVAFVLSRGAADWCAGGDCGPALKAALDAAVKPLIASHGPDPGAWRWGDAHQVSFSHPLLSQIPLLGPLSTARIAAPGDDTTIDRGGTNWALQDVHGPSYRGVYDLADLDRSLFVVTPGQSGHIMSRHARDFLTRWRDGATVPLGPLASRTEATLRLSP